MGRWVQVNSADWVDVEKVVTVTYWPTLPPVVPGSVAPSRHRLQVTVAGDAIPYRFVTREYEEAVLTALSHPLAPASPF